MTKPAPVTLETAKFANLFLHSEAYPYEIVRVISDKTVEIRQMTATLDPSWKADITPGGFSGHCNNQNTQRWIYSVDENAPIIRMRRVKPSHSNRMMNWKSAYGSHRLSETPYKFYDYNF